MEDHLRDRGLPVALVQLAGLGRLRRRHLRSSVAGEPRPDPMAAARAQSSRPPSSSSPSSACRSYCFHDHDIAPEGRTFAESRANLDAMVDEAEGAHGADRASSSCGARRTSSATRATRRAPRRTRTPRSSPTPPRRSRSMLEATQRLGGANYVLWGGREGYETLLNTDLAREEAQLARFLTLVAEHKHQHRLRGDAADRAQAAGADQAPVRLRRGHRPRLPGAPRPRRTSTASTSRSTTPRWPATASSTRSPTRSPRHLRQHRRQPRRLPERLGHGPVPQLRRRARRWRSTRSSAAAASPPAASTSTRSCAARASIGSTSSTPTSAASTRWRARCWSRPTWSSTGRSSGPRDERYAGWDGELGAADPGG